MNLELILESRTYQSYIFLISIYLYLSLISSIYKSILIYLNHTYIFYIWISKSLLISILIYLNRYHEVTYISLRACLNLISWIILESYIYLNLSFISFSITNLELYIILYLNRAYRVLYLSLISTFQLLNHIYLSWILYLSITNLELHNRAYELIL